jgi:Cu(I)/Ag(I) efflux system periplasmic protein CusF
MNRVPTLALAVLLSIASFTAVARSHEAGNASPTTPGQAAGEAGAFTVGEVRKIDRDAQKVTLRHGPIVNLEMPEMTMVFRAADAAMLNGLKVGDRVRFTADKVNGQFTVTQIVVVKQ